MNKKIKRQAIVDEPVSEAVDSNRLLHNIHQKLDNAAALNGGFDRLLYKIDAIETSQGQIVSKVDKIHDAIYDPDDGLFARIAAQKSTLTEISEWKQERQGASEDCEKEADVLQLKVQRLESAIVSVEKFQTTLFSAIKWCGVALGGGIVTLLFKVVYQVLKTMP